ncbi:MAG: hypothetical protein LQ350_001299 [Teloschistes chrysophthalmus]|nr:MAG: hypothetical protein LQ350_001299 [Niorma chrysophthalma]
MLICCTRFVVYILFKIPYFRSSLIMYQKQWQMPKRNFSSAPQIEPGDAGIWVTCDMHMEGLCTVELRDFFNECAKSFYGDSSIKDAPTEMSGENASEDIEAEINKEIEGMQDSKEKALFVAVKLEIPCVLFFKTREPVEPVSFVQRVCEEAMDKEARKTTRFVKRLTPTTRMGKASDKSLEEVAKAILAPVFHTGDAMAQKFAIRTTIRNNHAMKRDDVIKRVADLVGGPHTVDLKNYDRLILVDVYRNVLGMSVVGPSYEKLKRFNLAEIYDAGGAKSEH